MTSRFLTRLRKVVSIACLSASSLLFAQPPAVDLMRVPDGGALPQVCLDAEGTVHLLYAKGGSEPSDLFYVHMRTGEKEFSKPILVNSQPGSAVGWSPSTGGGQIAIGKGGRVHVAWNGRAAPKPKGEKGSEKIKGEGAPGKPKGKDGPPLFYARLNDEGTAFEQQRNLQGQTVALDGGGSVAADSEGNVYLLWQARGEKLGEQFRTVYMARSANEGRTFEKETRVNPEVTGACACCSVRAMTDALGRIFVAYRAAGDLVRRDSLLLFSNGPGKAFEAMKLGEWNVNYCPSSTYALAPTASGPLAAWEFKGDIFFAAFDPAKREVSKPILAGGEGTKRKYPIIVENSRGERLVAWTEGVLWNKPGTLAWQIYGADNQPIGAKGESPGVPASSMAAAFTRSDGSFVLVF